MENPEKLIIITSQNGPEFQNYWGLDGDDHILVKNGSEIGGFYLASLNPIARHEKLQKQIDDDGYLVMIHRHNDPVFEKRTFERDGKTITYHVYYYSTQDEQLNGDLWSIDNDYNDYNYVGSDKDPSCPFDILRMAIKRGQNTDPAVKKIIEWVENKTTAANILEVKLDTLHQCLTPEGAAKVAEIKNYDLLKDKVIAGNLTTDEFIKKKLVSEEDCFSDNYINSLSQLRDVLLEKDT